MTSIPPNQDIQVDAEPGLVSPVVSLPGVAESVQLETDEGAHVMLPVWLRKIAFLVLGLLGFVLALQLLKEGVGVYGSEIIRFLDVSTFANALGFGWLLAYIFLSGSPVAAIAVTFFAAGTISDIQTFAMITGSRLGASFIVLFVGFIYYLRGHQRTASIATGVLSLLTTAAIYLPALGLGYVVLTSGMLQPLQVDSLPEVGSFIDVLITPMVNLFNRWLPGWGVLLAGIGMLMMAFSLLDHALPEMNSDRSAFRRIGLLVYRPAAMFALGAGVTAVTMSVSVSLSIMVPLSARGLVRRENMLPYIMGANITTFIDTLVAALIVGGTAAFTIVFVEMASVTVLSLLVLVLAYQPFQHSILYLQSIITHNNRSLAIFLGVMLVIPILLLLVM